MAHSRLLIRGALASSAALMAFAALPGPAAAQPSGYYDSNGAYQECQDQRVGGTVAGAVIGGVLGAVVGGNIAGRGDRGSGAVVGGAVGAVAGGAVGASAADCDGRYSSQPGYDDRGYGRGYSDRDVPPPPPPPGSYDPYGNSYDRGPPPPDAYGNGYDDPGPPPPAPDAEGAPYGGPGYPDQGPADPYGPRR